MNQYKLERYFTRTIEHIHRVHKNMLLVVTDFKKDLCLSDEECRKLMFNVLNHDRSKFDDVQFLPYVELTEYYHQRKNIGNKEYDYPSDAIRSGVDIAVSDHYKKENHHLEKGDRKNKYEIIEIICDLQAMAQEFNEGTCRNYFENVWKKKYMNNIIDDFEWLSMIEVMDSVIRCFEKQKDEVK